MRSLFVVLCLLVAYHQTANSHSIRVRDVTKVDPPRFTVGQDSVRRDEAQLRCKRSGTRLVALRSEADMKEFIKFVKDDTPDASDQFWMGGIFLDTDECAGQPFNKACWMWDEEDEIFQKLNPQFVPFSTGASGHKPTRQSALVVRKSFKPTVTHAAGSVIMPYICDTKPPCNLYVCG